MSWARTVTIHPGSLLKSTTTRSQRPGSSAFWQVEALAAWSWIVFPMVGPRDRLEDRLDVVEQPVAAALGEVQVRAGVEYDPPTVGVNSVLFVTLHGCHDTGACGRRMRGAYAPTRATILGLERVVLVPTTTKCTSKMQRSGGYWNQDAGAIDKIVSELLAALAAQEAQAGLSRVAEKLAGLRASDAQPRAITSRRLRPRRPGWVLDAVREVMADHGADAGRAGSRGGRGVARRGGLQGLGELGACPPMPTGRSDCSCESREGGTCWRVIRGTRKAQAQRTQSSAVRRTVLGCVLRASPDKRPRRTGSGVRRRLQAAPGRAASLAA